MRVDLYTKIALTIIAIVLVTTVGCYGLIGEAVLGGMLERGTAEPAVDPYVYVMTTGTNYHELGCSYLTERPEHSSIGMLLSMAKENGYTRDLSGRCDPPR